MFFDELYTYLAFRELAKLRATPTKLCRKTCPDCGKKLVNVYYSAQSRRYHCKDCLKVKGE